MWRSIFRRGGYTSGTTAMATPSSFVRFASGGVASLLLLLGRANAQCVQVLNAAFEPPCDNACDSGTPFTFTIEGQTSVVDNVVNVAVVVDGSGSVSPDDFLLSKNFAKNTVAAFADENLFVNGGTASFVQFSSSANPGGTFSSQADFDAFVDAELQIESGTTIANGIDAGQALLDAAPATSTSFMVVTTDGRGGNSSPASDAAREAGTILFAVGVGPGPTTATLLDIAGDEANVFDVDNFEELDIALEGILSSLTGIVPCPATDASITLEFNAVVADGSVTAGSAYAVALPDAITYTVPDFEDNPVDFEALLDYCASTPGTDVVVSATYSDNEGNTPDLSPLQGVVPICDGSGTPAPVTPAPVTFATPAPVVSYSYSFSYEPWYDDDFDSSDDAMPAVPVYPSPVPPTDATPTAPVYPSPMPPTGAAPTAPSSPTGGSMCSNGIIGVESNNGDVCCVAECGSCGGVGCSEFSSDLSADDCCVTKILEDGEACSAWGEAPCFIDGESPIPSPTGTAPTAPKPAAPETVPTSPGTAPVAPVYTAPTTGAAPPSPSPVGSMTCSNGIHGIESDNGDVCCVAECGACGGVGCSRFSPDLGADDCCVAEILHDGEACSVTGTAPCFIDGNVPAPGPAPTKATTPAPLDGAPTMTRTPAPEHEFSYSFSYTNEPWYDDDEGEPTPAPYTTAPVTAPTPIPDPKPTIAPAPVTTGMPVTVTETFTVDVPDLAQSSLDFGLLVDVSGSYFGDIANLKLLAADLVQGLAEDTADLSLGLGSFSDSEEKTGIPGSEYTLVKSFGGCDTEVCYEQEQDDFISAVNTLDANQSGMDSTMPESQTIALVRAAEDWAWRAGVLKVLAITTDAPFHVPGDWYGSGDEYFTLDEVIAACSAENIKILALKAPGAGDEMDTIADGTGGVVATTMSDSEDIVDAILEGLAVVQYSKVAAEWVCEDSSWTFTADPSSGYDDVEGGESLDFTITVTVPAGTTAGTSCTANVLADDVLVGGQEFTYMADGTVAAVLFLP